MAAEDVASVSAALERLATELRDSTSSMTSVPKPLKFLRPHYSELRDAHTAASESDPNRCLLADVLSVLAMTCAEDGSRECLKFRLNGSEVSGMAGKCGCFCGLHGEG